MQVNLNEVPTVDEYLSIIRDFMLEVHQKLAEDDNSGHLNQSDAEIINRAVIKLKTNKDHIVMLEAHIRELEEEKSITQELRGEQYHLQKRLSQKADEIAILRETVKKLYADNQRLNTEKQQLVKELSAIKESHSIIKKKFKRQQDEMSTHKIELQKLTNTAQDRLNDYLREDKEKQMTIKRITAELQKLKLQLMKKDKHLANMSRKNEELKQVECDYEQTLALMETLKYENKLLKQQIQSAKLTHMQDNQRITAEKDRVNRQYEQEKDASIKLMTKNRQLEIQVQNQHEKIKGYEQQILMRTQKLKEKSQQIKTYNEQISHLVRKVQELSVMSDSVIDENRDLSGKCQAYQKQLQQMKAIHAYIGRIKGDLNYKKSLQLAKMIQSLSKLQNNI